MADKDLRDLLDGLFSDLPIEAAPTPDSSRDHVPGQKDELLARAVESITDAVIITDPNSIIQFVNPAAEQLTGYSMAELLGQTTDLFASGQDPSSLYEEMWETVMSGQAWHGELTNRRKDGTFYEAALTISPMLDEHGKVNQFVSVQRDIATVKQSETKYRTLFTHIADPIFIVDQETTRFLDCNQAALDRYGYTLDELQGMTLLQLYPAEEMENVQVKLGDAKTGILRHTHISKDGERLFVEIHSARIEHMGGNAWISIVRDITERQVPVLEQADLLTTLGRRNAQLQAAAQVSRAVSSILSLDDLLPQVVELIRTHLNLYYAGIFLVDESGEWSGEPGKWAVLRSGSGEAGRQMMTSDHKLEIGGTSMIGWCIANRKARISLRAGEEAMRFANPLLPETRSEIALPLISHNQVIGAMTIQDTGKAAFSQDDISILQTMADQLANAIENARLFQESGRQITELAIVNEISQAISSAFQLDELMETVRQQVNRLFDTTNFFIATYQEGSDKWQSTFHLEDGRRQASAWYGIKAGLTGHIIRSRQPLLFRSVQETIAFHQSQGASLIGETAHSWLGVPLVSGDKVVGVMAVQDYMREYLYSDQDLALFLTIAAQVAVALDSLRLLQETRRRAQELEVINRIGGAITSILDLDEVLYQIADTIKTHFKCYFVGISLLEEGRLVFHGGSTIGDSDVPLGLVGFDLGRGPSLIAQAARTGQPVLVNDVLADSRYLPLDELPDTRSELDLPIEVKGQVIGVLDVQSAQPDAFSPADVELLQSLANQAGIAIDNAHLFHETQVRAGREQILRQVATRVGGAPDVDTVMRTAVLEIGRILGRQTFIYLNDQEESSVSKSTKET